MGLASSTPEPPRRGMARQATRTENRPRQQQRSTPRHTPRHTPQPEPVKKDPPKPIFSASDVHHLISNGMLAPQEEECDEVLQSSSNECPICFMNWKALNMVTCCRQHICTGCYVDVRNRETSQESDNSALGLFQSAISSLGFNGSGCDAAVAAATICPFCNKVGFVPSNEHFGSTFPTKNHVQNFTSSKRTPESEQGTSHNEPSGTPNVAEDGADNDFVPKSSREDRDELERKIHEQHIGYADTRAYSYHGFSDFDPRSNTRRRSFTDPRSLTSADLENMTLEELRGLRLVSAMNNAINVHRNPRGLSTSANGSPRRQTQPSPRYHTSPVSRMDLRRQREAQYEEHMFMGADGVGNMEEMMLQAALKESMKSEYQGAPAAVEEGVNSTENESDPRRSSSSHEGESDSDSSSSGNLPEEMHALINDPSMSEEERLQLAMALSLSVQINKKERMKRRESEAEDEEQSIVKKNSSEDAAVEIEVSSNRQDASEASYMKDTSEKAEEASVADQACGLPAVPQQDSIAQKISADSAVPPLPPDSHDLK